MAGDTLTSGEYIKHHLTNLTYGQLPDGSWGIAHNAAEIKAMGFWSIHVDTMFWSIFLGVLFLYFFKKVHFFKEFDGNVTIRRCLWICNCNSLNQIRS